MRCFCPQGGNFAGFIAEGHKIGAPEFRSATVEMSVSALFAADKGSFTPMSATRLLTIEWE
jgi:hypothetical protein